MWVKTQTVTLSVLCSTAVVVASAAPVLPTTHSTSLGSAEYRYALTAASFDAAFNPIRYLGNVGGAAQAIASDVIYWQTPDFPLLVLSAQVDPSTGQYEAVQKVTSTTTHLQNLVSSVTAFPGASSSPQVQQVVSGIGSAGAAAAGATQTVTATLAPHLAPLTPVIYVVRVLRAAVGVYYAVATLSTTGVGTVLSGQNPLTAVANVVSSVQGLANVLAHAPRPTSSVSAGSTAAPTTAASTTAASQVAAKSTAAGEGDQPESRSVTGSFGKRTAKAAKSEEAHTESSASDRKSAAKKSADDDAAPKSTAAPTKPKGSAADKSTDSSDPQAASPAASPKKSKRATKREDHASRDNAAGHDESTPKAAAPKSKGEHGRRKS